VAERETIKEFAMPMDSRIQEALAGPDSLNQLRLLVKKLQSEGLSNDSILQSFEQARQHLREQGREQDENVVMELMDFLVGWCSPHMKLASEN
jgi:hypothetical protein